MNLLLQEKMCHLYSVYVNIHLDKYDVRTLKPKYERRDTESMFYEKQIDLYRSRSNSADYYAISLMNFVKNYEEQKGKLIERTNRTVVVAFLSGSSDPSSKYYHSYCKYMFINTQAMAWIVF